jgi:hypothetical protein
MEFAKISHSGDTGLHTTLRQPPKLTSVFPQAPKAVEQSDFPSVPTWDHIPKVPTARPWVPCLDCFSHA